MIGPDGQSIPALSNGAFPMMVQYLLPPGIRGIVVAGLLSALMGSLAGVFNACSTLFTVDLYEKWKKGASQHQLVRMGYIPISRRFRGIWLRRFLWFSSLEFSSSA